MRTRNQIPLPATIAAVIGLFLAGLAPPARACTLTHERSRVVTHVETPSTLSLDTADEIKLIGAMPPEPLAPQAAASATETPPARAAPEVANAPPEAITRSALSAMTVGKAIDIAVSGRRLDRYGRLLAHVFVGHGEARIWVQGRLVEDGLARAYALPGSVACLDELLRLERSARDALRGHWGAGVFVDRDAAAVRDLWALTDTFQTVTGKVASLSPGRGTERGATILTFEAQGGRALAAVLPARDGERPERPRRTGMPRQDWSHLAGAEVRIRGWIEPGRTGPRIVLSDAREIEVLVPAEATAAGAPPAAPPRSLVPPAMHTDVIPAGR